MTRIQIISMAKDGQRAEVVVISPAKKKGKHVSRTRHLRAYDAHRMSDYDGNLFKLAGGGFIASGSVKADRATVNAPVSA